MFMKVCIASFPPWVIMQNGTNNIRGILFDLFQFISISLNISYSLTEIKGKDLLRVGNNTFIEVFEKIRRNECDVTWIPMPVNNLFMSYFHQSAAFHLTRMLILSSGPKQSSQKVASYYLSINPEIALYVSIVLIICALMTFFFERTKENTKSFGEYFWYYFGSLFQEPYSQHLIKTSSKILSGIWWLSLVICISTIGGNLKASLAVTKYDTIDSLEDIVAKPNLQPIIIEGAALQVFFRNSEGGVEAKVYQQSLRKKGIKTWPQILQIGDDLVSGKSVLMGPDLAQLSLMPIYCKHRKVSQDSLRQSRQEVTTIPYAMTMNKAIPKDIKENIDRKIHYFATTQQIMRPYREQLNSLADCFWRPAPHGYQQANDLTLFSVIIFGGTAISMVVLIAENVYYYFHKCF